MTPKEKAEDLVRQFSFVEFDQVNGVRLVNPTLKQATKQCALIAVNEILDVSDSEHNYWLQVKAEIESL